MLLLCHWKQEKIAPMDKAILYIWNCLFNFACVGTLLSVGSYTEDREQTEPWELWGHIGFTPVCSHDQRSCRLDSFLLLVKV